MNGQDIADPHVVPARASGPRLPIGFGTLFGPAETLDAWLDHHAPALRRGLEQVAGREEWAVMLIQDPALRMAWLRANDPGLVALAATGSAPGAGPGAVFLMQRRLARQGEVAMATGNAAMAAQLAAAFQARGWAVQREHCRHAVAAWSLLAPANAGAGIALAEDAAALSGTGLALRVTGPWPPYAFARMIFLEQDNG